jgi:hypothetical protein
MLVILKSAPTRWRLQYVVLLFTVLVVLIPSRFCLSLSAHSKVPRVVKVALTREAGSNAALGSLLAKSSSIQVWTNSQIEFYNCPTYVIFIWIQCFEIPCIQFSVFGDQDRKLQQMMDKYDVITLTSPHSALEFCESWKKAGQPSVRVASIGTC